MTLRRMARMNHRPQQAGPVLGVAKGGAFWEPWRMEFTTLGRTGIKVSVAGLGCGGPSRLGMRGGASEAGAVKIVRRALDLGINFLDTAESYQTESAVGKAIADIKRQDVVISTKKGLAGDTDAAAVRLGLEASLKRLGTDYVDVYHLHGIKADRYDYAATEILPCLAKLREEGKIRAIGITEQFGSDCGHAMLSRATADGCWDVVMVGLNMLNPSARRNVLPVTMQKDIGVLVMFAVRRALSQPERLRATLQQLIDAGEIPAETLAAPDPLGFLLDGDDAGGLPAAAYRFARHEPGVHVVLTGTGSVEHLEQNVQSILKPPLSCDQLLRLDDLFGQVDSVSGN